MTDTRGIASVVFGCREVVVRSEAEDYRYLRYHWSSVYVILRPAHSLMRRWTVCLRIDETVKALGELALDHNLRNHYILRSPNRQYPSFCGSWLRQLAAQV